MNIFLDGTPSYIILIRINLHLSKTTINFLCQIVERIIMVSAT